MYSTQTFIHPRFHVASFLFLFGFNLQRSMFRIFLLPFIYRSISGIRYWLCSSRYDVHCSWRNILDDQWSLMARYPFSRNMFYPDNPFSSSVHLSLFLSIMNLHYAPINVFIFNFVLQFPCLSLRIERIHCIHLRSTIHLFTLPFICSLKQESFQKSIKNLIIQSLPRTYRSTILDYLPRNKFHGPVIMAFYE